VSESLKTIAAYAFVPSISSSFHVFLIAVTLAILSALPEEQQGLQHLLTNAQTLRHAGRDFTLGQLHGRAVVLALTGIGKVAAATTAAAVVERFGARQLLFTGVAGGVGAGVQVGDVVVARQFLQHDMDVRPLFPRWQVPGYAAPTLACDTAMSTALLAAAQDCVAQAAQWGEPLLAGHAPQAHAGLVASGDQFIVSAAVSGRITSELQAEGHLPLAVEMEGAAIAQACADYGIPFAAVRTISDRADDSAHVDFPAFVQAVASRYALHIVQHWVKLQPSV
jgi:adenosylhomocysteine nucleosidase